MRKIRINKDIAAVWRIKTNGVETAISGRDLTLYLVDPKKKKTAITFEPDGNAAKFRVPHALQEYTGIYGFEMWEDIGKATQTVVDHVQGFELVPLTDLESDGTIDDITNAVIEIGTGSLAIGIAGPRSPYAESDHATAQADHTQAVADHAVVEGLSTGIETEKVTIRNTKSEPSNVGEIYGGVSENLHIKALGEDCSIDLDSKTKVKGTLSVEDKINAKGEMSVSGTSTFGGKVTVNNTLSVSDGLNVCGASTFDAKINARGGLTVQDGQFKAMGNSHFEEKISAYGGIHVYGGELQTDGKVSIAGDCNIHGKSNVDGSLTTDGMLISEGGSILRTARVGEEASAEFKVTNDGVQITGNVTINGKTPATTEDIPDVSGKADKTTTGDLADLQTTAKGSLVAAINEARQSGGGGEEAKSYDYYMSILNTKSNG